ncbi:uncharacterized protein LOC108094857 [Drosophila ficusphila]|uniref:uncharacterized protein LOC108094857 n=1 Tax=Drosophila ficusphila TaxID=30025 RepID=UPI0007E7DD99|nr:uncharacterized protein LOC108094857 [Drosophila ficusphila]
MWLSIDERNLWRRKSKSGIRIRSSGEFNDFKAMQVKSEGLSVFLRSALSKPRRRHLRCLEDDLRNSLPQKEPIYQWKFFNLWKWPLLSGFASNYNPTSRRTPLLENFCLKRLLPDLKPLSINDTMGVYWLNRLTSFNPFGRRCYKRDELKKSSSFLWPFSAIGKRNYNDES